MSDSGKSAVQIHHMDPFGAGGEKTFRYRNGVGTIDGLSLGVPLDEADAFAFLKIDGR